MDAASLFAALAREAGGAQFANLLAMLQAANDGAGVSGNVVKVESAKGEAKSSEEKGEKDKQEIEGTGQERNAAQAIPATAVIAMPMAVSAASAAVSPANECADEKTKGVVRIGDAVSAKNVERPDNTCGVSKNCMDAQLPGDEKHVRASGVDVARPEKSAPEATPIIRQKSSEQVSRVHEEREQEASEAKSRIASETEDAGAQTPQIDVALARGVANAIQATRQSEPKTDTQVSRKMPELKKDVEVTGSGVQGTTDRIGNEPAATSKPAAAGMREPTKHAVVCKEGETSKVRVEVGLKAQAELTTVPRASQAFVNQGKTGGGEESTSQVVAFSVDRSLAEPAASSPIAFHVSRLAERLGGTEFQFGYRVNEAGGLQVTTRIHEQTVELGIAAEHMETATALKLELPTLDAQLREHSLHLGETQIVASHALAADMGMNWQRREHREWQMPKLLSGSPETGQTPEEVVLWNKIQAGGGVSLLA